MPVAAAPADAGLGAGGLEPVAEAPAGLMSPKRGRRGTRRQTPKSSTRSRSVHVSGDSVGSEPDLQRKADELMGDLMVRAEQLLQRRVKCKRFEYKERAEAATKLLTEFRSLVTELRSSKGLFVECAVEVERQLAATASSASERAEEVAERLQEVEGCLERARTEAATATAQLASLQEQQTAAAAETAQLKQQNETLQAELAQVKVKSAVDEQHLNDAVKMAEQLTAAHAKLNQELSDQATQREVALAELRSQLTQELSSAQGSLNEELSGAREESKQLQLDLSTLRADHSHSLKELEQTTVACFPNFSFCAIFCTGKRL